MPQQTLYPNQGAAPTPTRGASAAGNTPSAAPQRFYSPIPRQIFGLSAAGHLTGRDTQVLALLLSHKNKSGPMVRPKQSTMATMLGVSVDTIQRSIDRLAAAKMLHIVHRRSADGRKINNHYDLSATLEMLPSHTAKVRPGERQAADSPRDSQHDGQGSEQTANTIPQKCGLEAESGLVVEATPAREPGDDAEQAAVVDALTKAGVMPSAATMLVRVHDVDRIRRALFAVSVGKPKANPGGWIVAAVRDPKWLLPPLPGRPRRAAPRPAPDAPPDALDTLPQAQHDALEAIARAQLIGEYGPPVRDTLRRGLGCPLVRARMRLLLAAPDTAPDVTGHNWGHITTKES